MIKEYIQTNKERFVNELMEWLRIPSVSANSQNRRDMHHAAVFAKEKLLAAGCDKAELIDTPGHPVVYAEKFVGPNAPTLLVYGHYDVQPPDPLDLWSSPPFEPIIKDNKIFARGACDDKGQAYMHIKAFEAMMRLGERPCNVKFMIEGEEEIGSAHLGDFVRKHKSLLEADAILISDTSLISLDTPSITVGLRGLCYMEVEVTGPNRDLHSGVYGGAVANPINALASMIASLHDEKGRVTIPGFYDRVMSLTDTEREELNKAPFSMDHYKKELGIHEVKGEEGFTTLERTGIRPTLDVNGIWGGYIGQGAKTVLPSKAFAKISMRLVPDQSTDEIAQLFTNHFKTLAPHGVKVKVTTLHGGEPAVTPTNSIVYRSAEKAYLEVFGKKPIPTRDGGSIPIVALFKKELGLDSVLLGFGFDSDAIHSPNEHFGVKNFMLGIETIFTFYQTFAKEIKAKRAGQSEVKSKG